MELLDDAACVLQVVEDFDHVQGFLEDLLLVGEVPSDNGELVLDLLAGASELGVPALQDLDASLDVGDGLLGLLLGEDGLDVDFVAHFLADLIRDSLKDVLKLLDVVVNVAGNGPDELEAVQQGLHGLCDGLEVALGDDLELALERGQELDEVFGLGLLFDESLRLRVVLL